MAGTYDKGGCGNPNWKGGISSIRDANQILELPEFVQLSIKEKLLARYKLDEKTGCWNWTAGIFQATGRARITVGVAGLTAAKVSFVLHKGETGDLLVLHQCDNVLCVNPDHLWLGTNQDNTDDMVRKGRGAIGDKNGSRLHPEKLVRGDDHPLRINPTRVQGERNGRALLTDDQVREIRKRYKPYINNHKPSNRRELAAEFGVKPYVITLIVKNKTWRSVK